jgi:hypothetical protein
MNNYFKDAYGVLHQQLHDPFIKDYGIEYNRIRDLSHWLSYLRLGYINGAIPDINKLTTVLDVGFGNGDFLRACQRQFNICSGYDLIWNHLPENCVKSETMFDGHYDIITFYDSLEHFESIDFLNRLDCNYIVISVPNCKYPDDDEWFTNWKHRKPNEHLHHFNKESLTAFVESQGYRVITHSYIEDVIRQGKEPQNILTVVAKKL